VNMRVSMPDGTLLDGVNVDATSSAGTANGTTAGGLVSVDLLADTEYVLKFTGAGLADQVLPVQSPADGSAINIDVTMIARGAEQVFSAGSGFLTGGDGASVDVNGVNWVDSAGNPVTGDITATITPVDVSRGATLAAFPGEFAGVATGDTEDTPIVSFGVAEFEFSQNDAPVQPAAGQLVSIEIPIYFDADQDGNPFVGGEVIELWSLNEDTGIWAQEGTGVVTASAGSPSGWVLQATVSHFSWWNCDVSMNAATAFVTVFGSQPGTAVVKATTDANIGWRPNTVETVLPVGQTSGPLNIPSTGQVCFSADITFDDGNIATTTEVCVNPAPNGVETIDLFAPVAGPLALSRSPSGVVDGFAGFPVDKVRIYPTSLETSVTYSIAGGALPMGLSLVQVSATQAEIVGVAGEAGVFSVIIEGTDGVETQSITVDYNISADGPPPIFNSSFVGVELFDTSDSYDLNSELDLVNGGAATQWTLVEDIEGDPIPAWLDLDPATGILTINADVDEYWFGRVDASNASGSDDAFIDVCAGFFCEGPL
ncbi:MAG: hypothetical protein HKN85_07090, partial [Gammaproteobacteria bacterium]|nr:hypothetical protein [Gammaproteobacteria bacterium]